MSLYPGDYDTLTPVVQLQDWFDAEFMNKAYRLLDKLQRHVGKVGEATAGTIEYLLRNPNSLNPGHLHTMVKRHEPPPISANGAGTTGMVSWDNNYLYICVGTNTWKRLPFDPGNW